VGPAEEPDRLAESLVGPAADLARLWLDSAAPTRSERAQARRLHALTSDPGSVSFAMAFCDRVLRPESSQVAARQLRRLADGPRPAFLSPADRALLRWGARLSSAFPAAVVPQARRRLRALVGDLVADAHDPALGRHLARLRADGFGVNVNLLGEAVLGDEEAARRRGAIEALMERSDVDYVSVKVSSVAAQLNLWSYPETLARTKDALRHVLRAAASITPSTFVNLDMEEYGDLSLTLDAFTELFDEPEFLALEAGVVLQAYLPDSLDALVRLSAWAGARHRRGGSTVKVRIVKGANLAAERVDAAMHGWPLAPFGSKAGTDANHKAMLEYALRPEHHGALAVGVAGHNLFDLAWAHLLADARNVGPTVSFEMLQGMAPALARSVRDTTGHVLLYTPVVAPGDFDHALAYLFRRLQENAGGENFIAALGDLQDDGVFERERARFATAVARRNEVWAAPGRQRLADESRRHRDVRRFANEPDTDPTDPVGRRRLTEALDNESLEALPGELDEVGIDRVVRTAAAGAARWGAVPPHERAALLDRCAEKLSARRPALVMLMAREAGKTVAEADTEVSEAVDFARYYAMAARQLVRLDGTRAHPLGTVAVIGPWNFPLAIPIGGALAGLAAGNAVVLKPAPQTPAVAFAAAAACHAAGIPSDALICVRCPDGPVGSSLVRHPGLRGIVLTGSFETAELFAELAPGTPLMAETSGKNALVVMPEADVDLAAFDLVRSAFGYAGQKCSAASLAILVGDTGTSARFKAQLVDAVRSLQLGPATAAGTGMGPLVEAPPEKLLRALTSTEAHQRWLLEPHPVPGTPNLWSPGILDGVRPEDWFARTECFGPVLGLLAARDLDEAVSIQNALPFGLTGGIWSLDPADCTRWADRVEVGNAYVNRHITGAIVGRQPFGGWKRSVVGPGAKAGGPNYVLQLCRFEGTDDPRIGAEPSRQVRALLDALCTALPLSGAECAGLEAAARSDAHWWSTEFAVDHDPAGLFCESNVFRYRPLPGLTVRVGPDASARHLARVLLATAAVGAVPRVSLHPQTPLDPHLACDLVPDGTVVTELTADLLARLAPPALGRVRLLGTEPELATLEPAVHVDTRPPVQLGRVELLRCLREQAVSRTLHRYGNVVRPFDDHGLPTDPGPPATSTPADEVSLDDPDARWLAVVDRGT
jgi:RHH-type transcriptional regulator, proline utilization regulon repressor / proline dehydrogenase / delta 1-pyrroline-5-carboxylate dehydrogenase